MECRFSSGFEKLKGIEFMSQGLRGKVQQFVKMPEACLVYGLRILRLQDFRV